MSYINFLASWKKQDLATLKNIFSENIEIYIVGSDNLQIKLDYPNLIQLLEKRFEIRQDWSFDIIKQYSRGKENIVVTTISRENESAILLEPIALCILSFKDEEDTSKVIRIYMETNISS